ncbi:hypothetical protein [Nostoc sp. JL23]|uniref:hypothetical protein n=1 Tax=Nostoc sp. JL23 TaxID=2815394 RepID=UPI001D69BA17|nr:hypothetical protein [Nostoc sp. JL23]MBN3878709.1 hypothetical protein [Nostoc sp. JL23]
MYQAELPIPLIFNPLDIQFLAMAQKNETPLLVLSLLITVGFLGSIGWWVLKSYDMSKFSSSKPTPINSTLQPKSNLEKSSSFNTNLSSVPLNSTKGVDYNNLRRDLERYNWKQKC